MTRLAVATALSVLAYLALSTSVAETRRDVQTEFQHQACVDCPVMRVQYTPPRP